MKENKKRMNGAPLVEEDSMLLEDPSIESPLNLYESK